MARSTAESVADDSHDTPAGEGDAASYTPFDASQAVNASAYRAACLARAAALFNVDRYRRLAAANVRFVIDQQQPDGAWPHSANDARDRFVDHFHTYFVIGGLYRAYQALGDRHILRAVERGDAYYRERPFHPDGRPRPFAENSWPVPLRMLELYDHAEALQLALLLRHDGASESFAASMAAQLLALQTAQGFFVTRISAGGLRTRVPYHRWAQSQAFCVLARYYEHLGAST